MSSESINGINYSVRTRIVDGKETQIYYKDGKGYIKGADGKLKELSKVKDSAFEKAEYQTKEYQYALYKKRLADCDQKNQIYKRKADTRLISNLYDDEEYGALDNKRFRGVADSLVGTSYEFKNLKGIIRYDADKNEMWLQTIGERIETEYLNGFEVYKAPAYNFPEFRGGNNYRENSPKNGYYVKKRSSNRGEFMTQAQFDKFCAEQKMEHEDYKNSTAQLNFKSSMFDFHFKGPKAVEELSSDTKERLKGKDFNYKNTRFYADFDGEGKFKPYTDEVIGATSKFKVQMRTHYAPQDEREEYYNTPLEEGQIGRPRFPSYTFAPNNKEFIITFNDGREPITLSEEEYNNSEYSKLQKPSPSI